jgi:hypothetical protein
MPNKKQRVPIDKTVAARVLFEADRTCCVCRVPGKKLQIHHINDDPSDNRPTNLAVLCLECHGDTQVTGGFGRKLDADQVLLYRDDWRDIVTRRRVAAVAADAESIGTEQGRLEFYTSLTERLRENGEYYMLASIFDSIGNRELRDKYVELALEQNPDDDEMVVHLRALQDRQDLIPAEVAERRLDRQARNKDWSQRARTQFDLGNPVAAGLDYVRGINKALDEGRHFSAAFYLKELWERGVVEALFEQALTEAREADDLWWQVRALQELGWHDELNTLLIDNADRVEREAPLALHLLHAARGDDAAAQAARLDTFGSLKRVRLKQPDGSQHGTETGDDEGTRQDDEGDPRE